MKSLPSQGGGCTRTLYLQKQLPKYTDSRRSGRDIGMLKKGCQVDLDVCVSDGSRHLDGESYGPLRMSRFL